MRTRRAPVKTGTTDMNYPEATGKTQGGYYDAPVKTGMDCAPAATASSSGGSRGQAFTLLIAPWGTGWRVDVYVASRRVATTVENTPFEAAAIGVGLFQRASVVTCNKGNAEEVSDAIQD